MRVAFDFCSIEFVDLDFEAFYAHIVFVGFILDLKAFIFVLRALIKVLNVYFLSLIHI